MPVRASTSSVRVGLIGYGLAGSSFHAPVIAATPGLELAAIVTGNAERQRDAAAAYPAARIVESVQALWSSAKEIDLVVIATPNRTHVPLALDALEHDLHVVVDKPFAPSIEDAERVIDVARKRERMLTVYQNRRWDGDFLTLQQLVSDGMLGDVWRFESRFERWRPVARGGWRESGDPAEAGGLLFDLGSHVIDQALVLFGAVTHVYAEIDRRREGMQVDDDVCVIMTHANGVYSHVFMSAVAADMGPRFRVLGSRAAYVKWGMDPQEAKLRDGLRPDDEDFGLEPREQWGKIGAGDEARPVPTLPGDYRRFYAGVLRAVREEASPPVSPREAVASLAIIEAARKSATQHRVIAL
jgi:scyllo-inositol 2-dehydrogenase (NADP+)